MMLFVFLSLFHLFILLQVQHQYAFIQRNLDEQINHVVVVHSSESLQSDFKCKL